MSFGGLGMMAIAQNMPSPGELETAAGNLHATGDEKVAVFCEMLAQVLKQQGVTEQTEAPTEVLKLHCSQCGMEFQVTDAAGYWRKVEEGFLYACENGHPPNIVGSGARGMLTEEEEATRNNEPNIVTVYEKAQTPSPDSGG